MPPVLRAPEVRRRSSWRAPDVRAVLARADQADQRLVEHAGQLPDVVEDSLRRDATDLQGELAAVTELWDQQGPGAYRPNAEGHLADAITRHLRRELVDRGIVADREDVVRRVCPAGHRGDARTCT